MPKMTHWRNGPDPIDVSPEKAAVYAAQGWVTVDRAAARKSAPAVPAAMTTAALDPSVEFVREVPPTPADEAPRPAKKAAKKASKRAAKKS